MSTNVHQFKVDDHFIVRHNEAMCLTCKEMVFVDSLKSSHSQMEKLRRHCLFKHPDAERNFTRDRVIRPKSVIAPK